MILTTELYTDNLNMYRAALLIGLMRESGMERSEIKFVQIEDLTCEFNKHMIKKPSNLAMLLRREFYKMIGKYNHSRGKGDCRA